jgi:uncharacterized cupredoxin-like copper-binding protein
VTARRLVAFVALACVTAGVSAAPGIAGKDGESFVQVVEKEYTLTLSRQSVPAGRVSLELVNFGMDTHDLVVQSSRAGVKPIRFKQLDPRGRSDRTLTLKPGRYLLWCSIAGHRQKGMHATFVVRG